MSNFICCPPFRASCLYSKNCSLLYFLNMIFKNEKKKKKTKKKNKKQMIGSDNDNTI